MKQCKICKTIRHQHKDYFKSHRKICKYCLKSIEHLRNNNSIGVTQVSRLGNKWDTYELNLILIESSRRYNKKNRCRLNSRTLKIKIKKEYGIFKCSRCDEWHRVNNQKDYLKDKGVCNNCWLDYNRKYIADNYERYKEDNKRRTKEYVKNKYKKDPVFKFQRSVRSLISLTIKNNGYKKNSKTQSILGCDWETFRLHIERQFTKGMNWDNRDKWHIDHIYPISKAKTQEEIIRLNHYTNLRPLWAKDNMSKNNKIVEHQMKLPI